MIDIGANLADSSFDHDRERVIDAALEAGVDQLVLTGSHVEVSERAAEVARSRPGVLFATAGVHPHHADDCDEGWLARLERLTAEDHVVAVGECGLDFFRDLSPRDAQRERLEEHVALAERSGLPLFLHERDAADVMIEMMRACRNRFSRGVVHCFTGAEEALDAYLDLDLHIGITGWICDERRGLHLRDLIRRIPADRLMIETDAPYLLPRTIRPRPKSRRNEPRFLTYVRDMVAESRGETPEECSERTSATARAFFDLAPPPRAG